MKFRFFCHAQGKIAEEVNGHRCHCLAVYGVTINNNLLQFVVCLFTIIFMNINWTIRTRVLDGLIDKPHPKCITQILSKKVRLIHERLQYVHDDSLLLQM